MFWRKSRSLFKKVIKLKRSKFIQKNFKSQFECSAPFLQKNGEVNYMITFFKYVTGLQKLIRMEKVLANDVLVIIRKMKLNLI